MDLRKLALKKITEKGLTTSGQLIKLSGFSRAYVGRILKQLVDEGKIVLLGKASKAKYVLPGSENAKTPSVSKILRNQNLSEDEVFKDIEEESSVLRDLPRNVKSILAYGFTEMLNNAIEHSESEKIEIKFLQAAGQAKFMIRDLGIGVFRNIQQKFNLESETEAINHLLKGKQTTAPEAHSGEGIFFSSKAADMFILESFGKKLTVDNIGGNTFVKDIKPLRGTRVIFAVGVKSSKSLNDIFKEYSNESFEFSKTRVLVRLNAIDSVFLSRSQARRVVFGLEKFQEVVLDFAGVESVGQSFADEIFRVWQNNNSRIKIEHKNANENCLIMIQRAKSA